MQENKNEKQEMKKQYDAFKKSDLIKGLKKYLKDNKKTRTKVDGFGRRKGNGLERPRIDGKYYSWNEFTRLKKDIVLVYCFMVGCDLAYLTDLKKRDWFNVNKRIRSKAVKDGKTVIAVPGGWMIKPVGWKMGDSNV